MGKPKRKSAARAAQMRASRLWSVRQFNGGHTNAEWRALVVEFDGRCVRCERRGGYISRDHIIPIAQGGMDDIENIQPLCRKCNLTKGLETTDWKHYRRNHGWSSASPPTTYSKSKF